MQRGSLGRTLSEARPTALGAVLAHRITLEMTKARRGTGKAISGLARKLPGIIWWTLKTSWVFVNFPNFILAEESEIES